MAISDSSISPDTNIAMYFRVDIIGQVQYVANIASTMASTIT